MARYALLAPDGIDVYFDNVGGNLLEAALANLAVHARIVICGGIASGYDGKAPSTGPRNYLQLSLRRARMEGFVFLDYVHQFPKAFERLRDLVDAGRLVLREDIADGLERAPAALRGLFEGRNHGKQLVRVALEV